jgi:heme/copper-type cytochrome/quinol oxidase subunit 1
MADMPLDVWMILLALVLLIVSLAYVAGLQELP